MSMVSKDGEYPNVYTLFANVAGPLADQQHPFKQKKIRDHKLYYCTITITQVSDEKIGKSGDRSRNNTENKKNHYMGRADRIERSPCLWV